MVLNKNYIKRKHCKQCMCTCTCMFLTMKKYFTHLKWHYCVYPYNSVSILIHENIYASSYHTGQVLIPNTVYNICTICYRLERKQKLKNSKFVCYLQLQRNKLCYMRMSKQSMRYSDNKQLF